MGKERGLHARTMMSASRVTQKLPPLPKAVSDGRHTWGRGPLS